MGLVRKLFPWVRCTIVPLAMVFWCQGISLSYFLLFLIIIYFLPSLFFRITASSQIPLQVIEIWYGKNVFQILYGNKLLQPKISNKPKDSHKDLSEATALYECSSALFCHIMLYPKGILDELTKNICNRKNLPNDKEANSLDWMWQNYRWDIMRPRLIHLLWWFRKSRLLTQMNVRGR